LIENIRSCNLPLKVSILVVDGGSTALLGIIGWYINGNLAKSPKINGNASKLLDKMVPLLKYAEKMTGKK
jgi:hypothetical protein